ncbi:MULTISPECIES: lipid-A-disaccharide synthase N-terminal domain-containing protein [Geobacter]|uniref:Lipid A biosynthesis, N-terminal n=2 Tax=Geobacter TaxID=28231 RepID=A0A0C1TL54_9BACT|nr:MULTISPECIES: lipid-A-disaccharide synthase N-terminal domain-containing protein [Geobacter]ANA39795.1 Lipid A biosynthesis, N-terminal [Geobacter anodireducens]KIE41599.1 Lipid A biosynthesis, N-terminal [Geobacter soli]MBE2887498.1 lipid-A-disaccharide synthase N-terminal domain-containing protein [Geobacter anodireducens]UTG91904.1 lipid-A-disaccharide synthase N-terminal domain-containing protein [Geobacter sulfurreducens]HMN01855.1 lipid-A-disaccharide synthase N-terminal domain-contai
MSKAAMLTMGIGFAGQALFFMRFFVQWIHTERRKESVIPEAFWYFSIIGGLFLLVYAVIKQDPVFIVGQSTGTVIYLRNLYFIRKNKRKDVIDALES